ncbi:MAG: endonuclease domain-containing protein [Dehalococcoidia bacterium]
MTRNGLYQRELELKGLRDAAEARGEVLVAIMNNLLDFAIARDEHWYRIPVHVVESRLKKRWPPQWLAFYQTRVFGSEAYAVNYYSRVLAIRKVFRWQLFAEQPHDEKGKQRYYKLWLSPLQRLPQPILSRRWRLIVFIPTTWQKFVNAVEINDLYDESPLEDRLWAEFKRVNINAERQEFVQVKRRNYSLDFAIYCASGKIDVETDGDTWHASPERIPLDNLRDNDLETAGWKLLRFNTFQIREAMAEYCLPTIVENINRLGGLEEQRVVLPKRSLRAQWGQHQLTLFEHSIKDYPD